MKKKIKEEPQPAQKTLEQLRENQENFLKKRMGKEVVRQQPSEKGLAYLEQLKQRESSQKDFSLNGLLQSLNSTSNLKSRSITPYPVTFHDGKEFFKQILGRELSVNQRPLQIEEENIPKIKELIKYFIGQPSKLDPNKGIYLYGAVGRGKTIIMQSFMIMCSLMEKRFEAAGKQFAERKFTLKNAKSIVNELAENKSPQTMKRYYSGALCIDDLGAEDSYKLYGNDLNVLGDIVLERYQRYQQSGLITHATSNIRPEEWKQKYGERVESRMSEMFNVVLLLGSDKRKTD